MKIFAYAATAAVIFTATPALAEGNVDVHGGISGTCVEGACDSAKFVVGVGAGYDFAVGNNVFLGPQANVDLIRIGDSTLGNYSLVARLGTKIGEKSKIYALGGYAGQELGGGLGVASGWRLGAGYEHLLGKNIFLKIEYRYSQYSKYGFTGSQNSGIVGVGTHF